MTSYELRISDWSSDVCASDLAFLGVLDPVLVLILVVGLGVLGRDGENDAAGHITLDRERVAADQQVVGVELRRVGRRRGDAIAGGGEIALDDQRAGDVAGEARAEDRTSVV